MSDFKEAVLWFLFSRPDGASADRLVDNGFPRGGAPRRVRATRIAELGTMVRHGLLFTVKGTYGDVLKLSEKGKKELDAMTAVED